MSAQQRGQARPGNARPETGRAGPRRQSLAAGAPRLWARNAGPWNSGVLRQNRNGAPDCFGAPLV